MTPYEFGDFVEERLGWHIDMCSSELVPLVEYLERVLALYVEIYTHPANTQGQSEYEPADLRALREMLTGALCADFECGLAFGYVHSLYAAGLVNFSGIYLYGNPTGMALEVLECLQSMSTQELIDEADIGFICPSDEDDEDFDDEDDEPNPFDFKLTEPGE